MKDSPTRWPTVAAQVEELLLDRTFDGVLRVVQQRMPSASMQVLEDALMIVIERLVRNEHGPKDKIFWYLVNAATQQAKNLLTRDPARNEVGMEAAEGLQVDRDRPDYAHDREERARLALAYLLRITASWDSEGLALVTELHLRAALEDEPLSADEAAEIASGVLDRVISVSNARQLKARGFRRLARVLDPTNPNLFEEEYQ